jgi:hypothetical protein
MENINTEQIVSTLFKGNNPTQKFTQVFNKSLGIDVDIDNVNCEEGEIDVIKPGRNRSNLAPLQEDYVYQPPQQQQQQYSNQVSQKKVPLSGILPPEIIEMFQKEKDLTKTNTLNPSQQSFLQNNVRKDLLSETTNSNNKIKPIQTGNTGNEDIINKLVESVSVLTKHIAQNESKSNSNLITLKFGEEKITGEIKQNKKGQILFIIDESHCIILTPSDVKKYK